MSTNPSPPLVHPATSDETSLRLVRALWNALHVRRLRGPSDPRAEASAHAFRDALHEAAAVAGSVRLLRRGPHLWIDAHRLRSTPEYRTPVRALWQDLERAGCGGFEWLDGLSDASLAAFLDGYPKLHLLAAAFPEQAKEPLELAPGVRLLPPQLDVPSEGPDAEARRDAARRTFFRALAAAHGVVRQFAVHRIPELRKSRAVVHEMVDTLVEEEFTLLGLTAIQNFDPYTFQHSVHVSVLSMALGTRLGLPKNEVAALGVAAMFHDMGKTRVPKDVLQKPGRFDDREWVVMRTHPLSGARELLRLGAVSDLLVHVMLVSAEHHLRFDGSGYPRLGDDWTQGLFARIVTLADCFDAMTASRIYMKRPFTPDAVMRYLFENSGRMFDPDLLRLFVGMVGLYPVGSLVRLESAELALVLEPPADGREVERPKVGIIARTGKGSRIAEVRALSGGEAVDPRFRIQAGCHPLDHDVDVDSLLADHYLAA